MIGIVLIYGGEADWVDKTGAKRISERFPDHIRFINIENCGHNIPFDI
jgi:pimeloyl-ACP methyl ester carboxylesterase